MLHTLELCTKSQSFLEPAEYSSRERKAGVRQAPRNRGGRRREPATRWCASVGVDWCTSTRVLYDGERSLESLQRHFARVAFELSVLFTNRRLATCTVYVPSRRNATRDLRVEAAGGSGIELARGFDWAKESVCAGLEGLGFRTLEARAAIHAASFEILVGRLNMGQTECTRRGQTIVFWRATNCASRWNSPKCPDRT